jgi:hypothetical protein
MPFTSTPINSIENIILIMVPDVPYKVKFNAFPDALYQLII